MFLRAAPGSEMAFPMPSLIPFPRLVCGARDVLSGDLYCVFSCAFSCAFSFIRNTPTCIGEYLAALGGLWLLPFLMSFLLPFLKPFLMSFLGLRLDQKYHFRCLFDTFS